MRKKIDEIVKKEIDSFINEVTNKREINIHNAFDLSKIPIETLDRCYYNMGLMHASVGYGSELMKDDEGNYYNLNENDERVTPVEEVLIQLRSKYGTEKWQVVVERHEHDIQIFICVADYEETIDEITKDFEQMGYFLSTNEVVLDHKKRRWRKLQFEPIYQVDESNEILNHGDLLHFTPAYNIKDILNNGLQPRSDNGFFNYPNRIYMFMGNTPMNQIEILGAKLCKNNKNTNNNGTYFLLTINAKYLREHKYNICYDTNYTFGAYTEQAIPKEAIRVFRKYKFN